MKNIRKVYYLSSCSTCKRIMNEIGSKIDLFQIQDIKSEQMTTEQLDEMKNLSGSYSSLFSKRSMQYRALGLNEKNLGEEDCRDLILKEYTFLKRPVFIVDGEIFIGNSKKVVEALQQRLEGLE